MTVFFTAVVEPAALVSPLRVCFAENVTVPSGSDETSTRTESFPVRSITPVPETVFEPTVNVYATVAPIAPVITTGASVWSPLLTNGAISTTGAAGATVTVAAPATGGSVSGELIGLFPAVRSTSRWTPGVLPACGSRGLPFWSPHAASCWSTIPSSPNGSPFRVGVAAVMGGEVRVGAVARRERVQVLGKLRLHGAAHGRHPERRERRRDSCRTRRSSRSAGRRRCSRPGRRGRRRRGRRPPRTGSCRCRCW